MASILSAVNSSLTFDNDPACARWKHHRSPWEILIYAHVILVEANLRPTAVSSSETFIPRLQYYQPPNWWPLIIFKFFLETFTSPQRSKIWRMSFISLITDSAKHRRDGQLLLTVDVSKHHVVDIRRELDPRTLERDDTCAIKHRTIGMLALAEEHTR